MDLQLAVRKVMTAPTPAALWELQGRLLAAGTCQDSLAFRTLETFYHYLCELKSKATARQFSELASILDIGAVGGVAMENLIGGEGESLFKRFLLGAASESLMVLASRQYVKAWRSEMCAVHCQAAWFLSQELWHLSADMQPDLSAEKRWSAIQKILGLVPDPEVPNN